MPLPMYMCVFQRVHLDIQVGEHAVDYQQIQAKDKLSELQLRIRQLLDQVEQITKEQNYQRVRHTTPHSHHITRRYSCIFSPAAKNFGFITKINNLQNDKTNIYTVHININHNEADAMCLSQSV